jgi:hypothetical protein
MRGMEMPRAPTSDVCFSDGDIHVATSYSKQAIQSSGTSSQSILRRTIYIQEPWPQYSQSGLELLRQLSSYVLLWFRPRSNQAPDQQTPSTFNKYAIFPYCIQTNTSPGPRRTRSSPSFPRRNRRRIRKSILQRRIRTKNEQTRSITDSSTIVRPNLISLSHV